MNPGQPSAYIAFEGDHRIASGDLGTVAQAAKRALDSKAEASILIFDTGTSAPVEIDLRGSIADVLARLPASANTPPSEEGVEQSMRRGPGRPKLGVVAREITLLPRHWDWLAQQKGGASVAIRRLVEEARRSGEDKDRIRNAQDAAYRFMSAMAGNKPHFEDAIRALFAGDRTRFEERMATWPADVRDHSSNLAQGAFEHTKIPQVPAG